jgi:hypothetical protein
MRRSATTRNRRRRVRRVDNPSYGCSDSGLAILWRERRRPLARCRPCSCWPETRSPPTRLRPFGVPSSGGEKKGLGHKTEPEVSCRGQSRLGVSRLCPSPLSVRRLPRALPVCRVSRHRMGDKARARSQRCPHGRRPNGRPGTFVHRGDQPSASTSAAAILWRSRGLSSRPTRGPASTSSEAGPLPIPQSCAGRVGRSYSAHEPDHLRD